MEAAIEAYLASKARLARLLDQDPGDRPVPACPGWSVRDVVGHLAGMAEDVVGDDVDGFATEGWTAQHVARASHRSLPELLDGWQAVEGDLLGVLRDAESDHRVFAPLSVLVAFDALTHEQDIRTAIGAPPLSTGADVALVTEISTNGLRATHADLPAVEVEAGDTGQRWTIGRGAATAHVRAPAFELWRSLSGRRTVEQVRGYRWKGDAAVHVHAWLMPLFRWPEEPVGP